MADETTGIRIQKALSAAGVASRRAIEEMIGEGRISVNRETVRELPCFVTPDDLIRVDGRKVSLRHRNKLYYLINKPKGVVCTQSDPQGRPRAVDLAPPIGKRIYCVGRLDADSTGLLLLTNDGELTNLLTHPSHGLAKTYVVEVDGHVEAETLEKLKSGVHVGGKRTQRAGIRVLHSGPGRSMLEVTLREGRNRQVRRMLVQMGHKVRKLKRVAIGPITDRGLKVGHCRELLPGELTRLRKAAAQPAPARRRRTKN